MRTRLTVSWLFAIAMMTICWSQCPWAYAEDPAAPSATTEKRADDDAEAADPYEVPGGTNEELFEFIEKVQGLQPEGKSREEMLESFVKKHQAILQAVDKILGQNANAEETTKASTLKLEALIRLAQLGNEDAAAELKKVAESLADGDNEQLAETGKAILMQLKIREIATGNLDGAGALIDEFATKLEEDPDNQAAVRAALGLAQALEHSGDAGTKLAVQAYKKFGASMIASTNPQIAEYGKKLEGVVRRLELLGNSMEITGTLLDGTTFDPDSLKGKVVLVDFWATWCGPCIAELPNVLANYEKYHDKGFEVIGISLDNDRESLEKFMEERKLPWPILYEDGDGTRGWSNPMATKYGIVGIPTVILINADGKVVSLNARGDKLGELLEELLGEKKP